jgi:hypothetical protein
MVNQRRIAACTKHQEAFMEIMLTNFDCIECGEQSPYAVMRIPFRCKCNHKGNWSTLPKNIFEGGEYPESLKKFYAVFHQTE